MARIKVRTTDPKAFQKALMREGEVLFPQYVRNFTAGVVARLYEGIVVGTPVLTGRARRNWFVTTSGPSTRVIDGDQLITEPGHWFRTTGEPLNSEERGARDAIVDALHDGPVGRKVFITNNLSYIGELEDGTSAKAPAGMVAITVAWVTGAGVQAKIAVEARQAL